MTFLIFQDGDLDTPAVCQEVKSLEEAKYLLEHFIGLTISKVTQILWYSWKAIEFWFQKYH